MSIKVSVAAIRYASPVTAAAPKTYSIVDAVKALAAAKTECEKLVEARKVMPEMMNTPVDF